MSDAMNHDQFFEYVKDRVNAERASKGLEPLNNEQIEQAFKLIDALCTAFESDGGQS